MDSVRVPPARSAIRGASLAVAGFKWPFGPPPPGPTRSERRWPDIQEGRQHPAQHGRAEHGVVCAGPGPFLPSDVSDRRARSTWGSVTATSAATASQGAPDCGARAAHGRTREPLRGKSGVCSAHRSDVVSDARGLAGGCGGQGRSVVVLTSKMRPDGTLDWTPPAGAWVVLRLGYSLLGITNHPAPPEGTGLEVDKLNPEHVKAYMNTYLDKYQSAVGSLDGSARLAVSDQRQLGGGGAELDREHARGVRPAARLRSRTPGCLP